MSDLVTIHVVEPGDTLSQIAVRYGVSVEALQRRNGIEDPDLVVVGQEFVVQVPADATGTSATGRVEYRTTQGTGDQSDAQAAEILILVACAIGFLLLLLFGARRADTATSGSSSGGPSGRDAPASREAPVERPETDAEFVPPRPPTNDGERFLASEMTRHYPDSILINDVMLPAGRGTTQIDHILITPSVVFVIETKDMSGWLFGTPGQRYWTQVLLADRWSRGLGIRTTKHRFYNPLMQNEGHARALVKLGIVERSRVRPVAAFVGNAELRTAESFLPYREHESVARENGRMRLRGVLCMRLAELHAYIDLCRATSTVRERTREQMESVYRRVRAAAIPVTERTRQEHASFVRSVKRRAAG